LQHAIKEKTIKDTREEDKSKEKTYGSKQRGKSFLNYSPLV